MRTARINRRVFGRWLGGSAIGLALVSTGARESRAAYSCDIPNRECVSRQTGEPACTPTCRIFCLGRAREACPACAICYPDAS